ncbi:MAG: hypothetical protein GY953_53335 [bacterium]|nr:hypothetical protein [bacterium]
MGEPLPEKPLGIGLQVRPVQREVFEPQPGIKIPAFVIRPGPDGALPEAGVLVAVDDRGKEALASDPLVIEAVRRGWMVWAIDPRGIGELDTGKPGWVFAVSLLLGENFVWRQGWDIRRVVELADNMSTHNAALYARGHNAALAATYAVATLSDSVLQWAVLRDGFVSYRQFIDRPASMAASFRLQMSDVREQRTTAFDREIPHAYFPFGVLEVTDLPRLLDEAGVKTVLIDPIDGDWQRLSSGRLTTMDGFLRSDW